MSGTFDPNILTSDFRTPGERDRDKITFSQPFRALAGKAQVHSPETHDDIRSRLTHSLEVSCVAGSLGTHVAHAIGPEKIPTGLLPRDAQSIRNAVGAGALMHDIGNTPFSHPGEEAVRLFFEKHPNGQKIISHLPAEEQPAFLNFHGNMQAFRIATTSGWKGSMNLTPLTLAAFCKYPTVRGVKTEGKPRRIGIFYSDRKEWRKIARELGLSPIKSARKIPRDPTASDDPDHHTHLDWHRHILSYITEAADDICYLTADLEDAATLGIISVSTVLNFLKSLCPSNIKTETPDNHRSIFHEDGMMYATETQRERNMIRYYRSQAITQLILECTEAAIKNRHKLLMPERYGIAPSLMSEIAIQDKLKEIRNFSQKHIYDHRVSTLMPGENTDPDNIHRMYKTCALMAQEILHPGSTSDDIRKVLDESCLDPAANEAHKIVDAVTSLSDTAATRLSGLCAPLGVAADLPTI